MPDGTLAGPPGPWREPIIHGYWVDFLGERGISFSQDFVKLCEDFGELYI